MRKLGALLIIVGGALAASGQVRTFNYELYGCKFRATYDAKKYTSRQLRDTVKLIESIPSVPLMTNATPFTLAEIDRLDVAALDNEYRSVSREINALRMVPTPYFEKLKARRLAGLERMYELSRSSILSYKTPSSLSTVTWAPACSAKYAKPLITGGDDLLAIWLEVNMQSREKNASPERIRREYEQQLASPDRMRYARAEVMAFGWWNCANEKIDYGDSERDHHEDELKKLFKKVRMLYCYDA
jgi:hypothetical protein